MDGVSFHCQPDTSLIIIKSRIKYLQCAKLFMFESSHYKFEIKVLENFQKITK